MNNLFQGSKQTSIESISQTNAFKDTIHRITNQGEIYDKLNNYEKSRTLHDLNMERSFQNINLNENHSPMLHIHNPIHQSQNFSDQNEILRRNIPDNKISNIESNININNSYLSDQLNYNRGGYLPMPMNNIHPMLYEFNKQLEEESNVNILKTHTEEKNQNEKQTEILQDIINVMENQEDERHKNSEFLKFIQRLKTGDIKLNEKENTIDENINDEKSMENIWNKIENEMNFGGGFGNFPQDENANITTSKDYLFMKDNPYLINENSQNFVNSNISNNLVDIDKSDITQARYALEAEVQRNPDNAEAWVNLGKVHTENDRDDLAMQCFLKALEADSFNADALLALGISCTNEFDEFDAMVYLKEWIKRHHIYNKYFDNKNPLLDSDLIKKEMSYDREEEDYYSKAIRMEGLKKNFYREMCNLMENIGRNEKVNPDTDIWIALGIAHFIPHENERAIECFRKAVEINPKDYNAWNKLGAILAHSKMNKEAILTYRKALELKPNYARCWANLGIALFNVDDYYESMRAFLQALKVFKDIPHVWSYMSSLALTMNSNNKELYQLVNSRNLEELLRIHSV